MVAKIKAALAARTDPDFFIMARSDAMRTDGYAEGIERVNAVDVSDGAALPITQALKRVSKSYDERRLG